MREEYPSESRPKPCKFSDQNQMVRANFKVVSNSSKLKSASAWGSHIVKGLSGEKKSKVQRAKPPLTSLEISNQKIPFGSNQSRVKRSLIGDFPCTANYAQVHPHAFDSHHTKSSSRDLFLELDHLRSLLGESKERESKLKAELLDYKKNAKVCDLERGLESKRNEVENLVQRVRFLETEKSSFSEQLASLSSILESQPESSKREELGNSTASQKNLEMEVVELRRMNKELQLQKRNLACHLSSAESQLAALAKVSESDIVAKVEAEASLLRHTNENLSKQVEGLQMSRLTEVEELVYLRWVNSCLRNELRNVGSTMDSDKVSTPNSVEEDSESVGSMSLPCKTSFEFSNAKKPSMINNLKRWPKVGEDLSDLECPQHLLDKDWIDQQEYVSPQRRHSICGSKYCAEDLIPNKRRQSDGFISPKELEKNVVPLVAQEYDLCVVQSPQFFVNKQETNKITASLDVEKRPLRIPNPPPRPSVSLPSEAREHGNASIPAPPPPPPPPPPPKFSARSSTSAVQRAPEVVEFYHSLMKRDSRKEPSSGGICDAPDVANVHSSMIGEIENRSSHLLAIKADVETQGEFVNSLIREVNGAVYQDIEDVVAFVKWLDEELCFLVDERAVLKHFDWPEKKSDTLREAAFGYRDLKKLEAEVSSYEDDPRLPCDIALKKMLTLSEKIERRVYNLLRTRDVLMRSCREFQIPTNWMLDTGIISKIKFGSVNLAKKYMKRVAMELHCKGASEKDPALDYMLLQGVRFAFRIHQFAGGFDAETMHAFEELRNLACPK
ncbi:protein CHUP1, chloroplastic-like [Macadamia integrifolia]|uniref:protein CHUP1, chloroplastic-like n=1 Tax=Macadamia integrifolia TaxID=60698 RepID=UPI001C5330CA|nr:protein CHUP1, chloroplastic-like [Macadamia integrifolia]XP_042477471.1 protein CHUP1, chloroplastic-like [Macadamia integrifolia]XP_042477472.1 protein CHUP1, chloroplastic-like [Macadamia integrifolia]